MEQSPGKPYLVIGIITLVIISVALIWKGGLFVSTPPAAVLPPTVEVAPAVLQLPAGQIRETVTRVDASARRITLTVGDAGDRGRGAARNAVGIITDKTEFFYMVKGKDYGNILVFRPSSVGDLAKGQAVILSVKGGAAETAQDEFETVSVTIEEFR